MQIIFMQMITYGCYSNPTPFHSTFQTIYPFEMVSDLHLVFRRAESNVISVGQKAITLR